MVVKFRYKIGYHEVPELRNKFLDVANWCNENIGERRITWDFDLYKCRFRFKRDYTMFLLRWA